MKTKEIFGGIAFFIGLVLCASGCLWGLLPIVIIAVLATKQPVQSNEKDTAWKDVYGVDYRCNAFGERLK